MLCLTLPNCQDMFPANISQIQANEAEVPGKMLWNGFRISTHNEHINNWNSTKINLYHTSVPSSTFTFWRARRFTSLALIMLHLAAAAIFFSSPLLDTLFKFGLDTEKLGELMEVTDTLRLGLDWARLFRFIVTLSQFLRFRRRFRMHTITIVTAAEAMMRMMTGRMA